MEKVDEIYQLTWRDPFPAAQICPHSTGYFETPPSRAVNIRNIVSYSFQIPCRSNCEVSSKASVKERIQIRSFSKQRTGFHKIYSPAPQSRRDWHSHHARKAFDAIRIRSSTASLSAVARPVADVNAPSARSVCTAAVGSPTSLRASIARIAPTTMASV